MENSRSAASGSLRAKKAHRRNPDVLMGVLGAVESHLGPSVVKENHFKANARKVVVIPFRAKDQRADQVESLSKVKGPREPRPLLRGGILLGELRGSLRLAPARERNSEISDELKILCFAFAHARPLSAHRLCVQV